MIQSKAEIDRKVEALTRTQRRALIRLWCKTWFWYFLTREHPGMAEARWGTGLNGMDLGQRDTVEGKRVIVSPTPASKGRGVSLGASSPQNEVKTPTRLNPLTGSFLKSSQRTIQALHNDLPIDVREEDIKSPIIKPTPFKNDSEANDCLPGNGYVWTLDREDLSNPIKQFPRQKYLWLIYCNLGEHNVLDKSAQMMLTWFFCAYDYWKAAFHQGVFQIVQTTELMDAGFGDEESNLSRIAFIHNHVPEWIRPRTKRKDLPEPGYSGSQQIFFPDLNSTIKAVSQDPNDFRGDQMTDWHNDETAWQWKAEVAYTAGIPRLKRQLIMVSTANAETGQFFTKMCYPEGTEGKYPQSNPEAKVMEGLYITRLPNKFMRFEIDFTADPKKRGKAYLDEMADKYPLGLDDPMCRQEMFRDHRVILGKRITPQFKKDVHVRKDLEVLSDLPIYIGMDFGYHRPALRFLQILKKEFEETGENGVKVLSSIYQIRSLRERLFKDMLTGDLGIQSLLILEEHFPGLERFFCCDPAGTQKHPQTDMTDIEILESMEIYPAYKESMKVHDRARRRRTLIQMKLKERLPDGEPAYLIDKEGCPLSIESLEKRWRYDEHNEPKKDGTSEHLMDAEGYPLLETINVWEDKQVSRIIDPMSLEALMKLGEDQRKHASLGGHQRPARGN